MKEGPDTTQLHSGSQRLSHVRLIQFFSFNRFSSLIEQGILEMQQRGLDISQAFDKFSDVFLIDKISTVSWI